MRKIYFHFFQFLWSKNRLLAGSREHLGSGKTVGDQQHESAMEE